HLGGQIEVTLQRGPLRLAQVVEAVAHQRVGQQSVLFYSFVALLAQPVATLGHSFQRRIYVAQQTSKASFLRRERNRCFQATLPTLQLPVKKSYSQRGHDRLLLKFVFYSMAVLRTKSHFPVFNWFSQTKETWADVVYAGNRQHR